MTTLAIGLQPRRRRLIVAGGSLAAAVGASLLFVFAPLVLLVMLAAVAIAVGLALPVAGIGIAMASVVGLLFVDHPLLVGFVAVFITALLVLASRDRGSSRQLRTPRLIALLGGYLAVSWLIASSIASVDFEPIQVIALWGLQLSPLLLGFVLTRARSELVMVQWIFVGIAVVVALVQIATPAQPEVILDSGGVGASLAMNRNALGVLYLLAVAIVLPRVRLPPRPVDLALIAIAICLVIATADGLSRSSYLAAASMVLAFLLLRGWRFGALVLVAALIVVPLAIGGEVNSFSQALARFTTTFSEGGLDSSSGARLDLWLAALKATAEHPLFGLGYQQFAANLPALWEGSVSDLAIASRAGLFAYAHNLYLTVLSQGGLVGFALMLAVIVSCSRDAFGARSPYRETALLALVAVGAASVFGEPILVAAVSLPFLVTNALARMTVSVRDEAA